VLTWAVVEEAERHAGVTRETLEGKLPQELEAAAQQLEELQREYAALKEAVDSKVGGGWGAVGWGVFVGLWRGCAVRSGVDLALCRDGD